MVPADMVDVVGELEVLDKVSALSPRFQGCEIELFESLCVVLVNRLFGLKCDTVLEIRRN